MFRYLKIGSFKTRECYGKAFKQLMVFLGNKYHLQKLSNISPKHIFAYLKYMQGKGLQHIFAHEQYEKYINQGFSDYAARKKVSELLGHHRDNVTRIYLSDGE